MKSIIKKATIYTIKFENCKSITSFAANISLKFSKAEVELTADFDKHTVTAVITDASVCTSFEQYHDEMQLLK